MVHTTRQLERVRQTSRLLLLLQGLAQLVSGVLLVLLSGGLLDYALRLPGWLRLGIGLSVVGVGAVWLFRRVSRVLRFWPTLSTLALRAEQLYPHLTGILASGVELAVDQASRDESVVTRALTRTSVVRAQAHLERVSLWRLVNPARTIRLLSAAAIVLLVFGAVLGVAPGASRLAAKRWFDPLGPARWPNRTRIHSLMEDRVWPSDTPLRLRASVERGYSPGMRTWIVYRVLERDGQNEAWESVLMSYQIQDSAHQTKQADASSLGMSTVVTQHVFERVIDLTHRLPSEGIGAHTKVEFYFLAGDDRTAPQSLRLVARPWVDTIIASIEPPLYARGLVSQKQQRLDQQVGQVATAHALIGSTVDLRITFNKPISAPESGWDEFLPGLSRYTNRPAKAIASPQEHNGIRTILKSFVIDQTVETSLRITDQHGLGNLSEKVYRLVAIPDKPPVVSMVRPAVDEAVLPTALIQIEAVAQDDVGLGGLILEAQVPVRDTDDNTTVSRRVLGQVSAHRVRLNTQHMIDLGPWSLRPGDEVILTAVAHDVFELDDRRHEPVRSSPRRLQIVDVATLIGQIQSELVGVRQQAIRLEQQQRGLLEESADSAAPRQQQLTSYLEAQQAQVAEVKQRINRNRLDPDQAGQLHQLVNRAAAISQNARRSSQIAQQHLEQKRLGSQQVDSGRALARDQQQNVSRRLTELIDLLDQGRDALALHLQLQQFKALQEALMAQTRRLMPLTLGWSVNQLNESQRHKLKDLADRQGELLKLAQAMLKRMQATSDALRQQGTRPDDQALAQVMAQAVSIARRQGLVKVLQRATDETQQNQLSDARNDQRFALELVQKMLTELGEVDQRQQAILRRWLVQLAQAVRQLINQQEAQLDKLEQVRDTTGLEDPLAALRRHTMAVALRARETAEAESVSNLLDQAAAEHAVAIPALRQIRRNVAQAAEHQALVHMKKALASIQKLEQAARMNQVLNQRRQLQEAYQKLAQEQETLRDETAKLIGQVPLSRRKRAASLDLGHRQADLKIASSQLGTQVQQTLVFTFLHEQIDQESNVVVPQLRLAKPDQDVIKRQESIGGMLWQMVGALATPQQKQPFTGQHGRGGGGGGNAAAAALVPPLAELRLLRRMQQAVYRSTRQVDQPVPAGGVDRKGQIIGGLATQQHQLAVLGERLIQMIQQSKQDPPDHRQSIE